jgi:hypothetical protein
MDGDAALVRAEYLYVGLDKNTQTVNSTLVNSSHTLPGGGGNNGSLSAATVVTSARFDENVFRGGVNYRF